MTDKPTPTTDLLKRCAEIHEWRSTGVLSGEALRDYAKRKWPDRHDTLQMAEHETVTEALALLAKWGPPAVKGEPFGYFHQLLNHEGKGNGVWLGAAERKVVEQAHTPGETSEEIVALYTAPQPTRPDPAYSEACNLATALFKKHFAHLPDFASGQAVWSLCDSTAGVISQIDNMVAGLVQPPTSPQADSVLEDAARYRWLRDQAHPDSEDSGIAVSESDFNDWGNKFTRYYSGEELDAAIDAARKQGAR